MTTPPGSFLAFDRVADDYDNTRVMPPAVLDDIARLCISQADLAHGGFFLDAGVGTGRFAAPLARLAPGQIVGADFSLPMMQRARAKAGADSLLLVRADLQRLPFGDHSVKAALMVHILHLIENWEQVVEEVRRVLVSGGVLLLGAEMGGRSTVIDFYYERARAQGILRPRLGAGSLTHTLAALRRPAHGAARTQALSAPFLSWTRAAPVAETLDALARRTYSQMWSIPDDAHTLLLADAKDYALRTFGPDGVETSAARFALHAVRWP